MRRRHNNSLFNAGNGRLGRLMIVDRGERHDSSFTLRRVGDEALAGLPVENAETVHFPLGAEPLRTHR